MPTPAPDIPLEAQIEALARHKIHELLAQYGVHTSDPRRFLQVTRRQMTDYFRQHPHEAEANIITPSDRPFHDCLCLERRRSKFAVFDMDYGSPRGEKLYDSLPEAAADLVAFQIGYGYPA